MRIVLALVSTVVLAGVALGYVRYMTDGGVPIRWYADTIEVQVAPVPASLAADLTMTAVKDAVAAWTVIDCDAPTVSVVSDDAAKIDEADGRNSIVWFTDARAWNESFSSVELARTLVIHKVLSGTIVEADIAVNLGGFPFSVGPVCELGRWDLQGALTHELGHFFGLDHSLVASATMTARTDPADCELRTLDADDIAGFCASYDRPAVVEPEVEPDGAEGVEQVEVGDVGAEVEPVRSPDDGGCGAGGGLAGGGLVGLVVCRVRRGRRANG